MLCFDNFYFVWEVTRNLPEKCSIQFWKLFYCGYKGPITDSTSENIQSIFWPFRFRWTVSLPIYTTFCISDSDFDHKLSECTSSVQALGNVYISKLQILDTMMPAQSDTQYRHSNNK